MSQLDIRSLSFPKTTTPLGFSIRGGFEHGTSVFVSNVASGSPADAAGLRVGDEILEVNGFSITQSTHNEAISLIKSTKRLSLRVKNGDVLPRKDNNNDPVSWYFVGKMEKKKIESSSSVNHSLPPVSTSKFRSIHPLKVHDAHESPISELDSELHAAHSNDPSYREKLDDEKETEEDADKFISIV